MKVENNGFGKIYETTYWGKGSTPTSSEDEPNTIGWGVRVITYLKSLFN